MKQKTFLFGLLSLLLTLSQSFSAPKGWETDFDTAVTKAQTEGKKLLVEFTGSDWCPPCMMMAKRVFSKKDFIKEATKDFVLLKLDFPRSNPALSKANEKYAKRFNVTGFPTIAILNQSAKMETSFIASQYPSVNKMLKQLNSLK